MGVHGLTSFVDENSHLLTDLELHGCRLIIDGNNLYHFLYYYFKIPTQYAGDYSQFERSVRYFFETLKACDVCPYVVFDGALDKEERKLRTSLQRAKNRLHIVESLSQGRNGKILPVLAFETFRQVLNDIGIAHVTCDYEADNEIAALSHYWQCPVLTNDSDFFIFDLRGGYIVLDYLNLQLHSKEQKDGEDGPKPKFLKVQIYYFDTFLSQFSGLERRVIPLFATLLGNDFVPGKTFEIFFCGVKFVKPSSDKLFASKRFGKIAGLLQWLEHMETYDNAVGKILEHFPCGKRAHIKDVINRCVEMYTELSTNLVGYFESNAEATTDHSELKSHRGSPLPGWFTEKVRQGEMSVLIMNALVHRKVLLLSQVEKLTDPSAHLCARSIRAAIYAILITFDSRDLEDHELSVEEYDRVQKNLEKNRIVAVSELEYGVRLPQLHRVPCMSITERATVISNVLGIKEELFTLVPPDAKLVLMAVVFWVKNGIPRIGNLHLMAMLVSLLNFWPVDQLASMVEQSLPEISREASPPNPSQFVATVSSKCSKDDVEKASAKLQRFATAPKHSKRCLFDCSIVHAYSQFQACFLGVVYLNQVLSSPHAYPSPARFCNGTFFYNLARELKSRRSPAAYLDELLNSSPGIMECYGHLYSTVCQALPSDIFSSGKKKKKKKKSKDKKGDTAASSDDSDGGNGPEKVELDVNCDLSNRFGCLVLDQ